jgi:hypothetical protein
MMIIAALQYRNPGRSCRSSAGHGVPCSDQQLRSLRKVLLSIDAPIRDRNNLPSHRIGLGQCARSTCRNSHTEPAAPKSP